MGRLDLTNKRFGRLVALDIGKVVQKEPRSAGTIIFWRCKCDCGNEVLVRMADLDSQYEKLIEEKNEVLKELVDVAIVCAGIYRFDQYEAIRLMNRAYMACEILGFKMSDLEKEVNRKWQINLKRKWEWNGKTYHHIEEKNDEKM